MISVRFLYFVVEILIAYESEGEKDECKSEYSVSAS